MAYICPTAVLICIEIGRIAQVPCVWGSQLARDYETLGLIQLGLVVLTLKLFSNAKTSKEKSVEWGENHSDDFLKLKL